jgi:serine/threonine protein kinase
MFRSSDQIGPYKLIKKIGHGSFGVVWLAERQTPITTTTVALKMPLDEDLDLESVKQEAYVWVQASGHPNVLPIIEANIYDAQIIIASEYAPDGSLEAWLRRHGGAAPSIPVAIDIASGILAGLRHLHSRSIIHRDLKPANILLQGNIPRLTDFGISRILKTTSQSLTVAGSPAYMAPEAFDGKRNEQTDIWSAGVILYELLAGHLPFHGADMTSLVGAILTRNPEPLPLTVPKQLHETIACSLSKDKRLRYKSAGEMLEALQRGRDPNINSYYPPEPVTIPAVIPIIKPPPVDTSPHPQPKAIQRGMAFKLAIAAIILAGLVLAGAAILYIVPDRTSSMESKPETTTSLQPNNTEYYKVIPTQDGYTSVREAPTTKSAEKGRLSAGTVVPCRTVVKGEYIWGSSDWRYCPDVDGYIHCKLLIPAQ